MFQGWTSTHISHQCHLFEKNTVHGNPFHIAFSARKANDENLALMSCALETGAHEPDGVENNIDASVIGCLEDTLPPLRLDGVVEAAARPESFCVGTLVCRPRRAQHATAHRDGNLDSH